MANPIITYITLDLNGQNNFDYVPAVQGDSKTRYVYATLVDNGQPYDITQGVFMLRGTKPDGTTIFNVCEVKDNEYVTFELTQQMLAASGIETLDIMNISKDEESSEPIVISTFSFQVYIAPASLCATTITSSDDWSVIADVLQNLDDLEEAVEKAEESATNAKTSEDNAKTSETNAKTSEENAKTSENNAEESAQDSADSADLSKQWAVGNTGSGTDEPSDTNNSYYYSQQSYNSSLDSADSADESADSATESAESALLSESWAIGGTGISTRIDEDTNNSKYYSQKSADSAVLSEQSHQDTIADGEAIIQQLKDAIGSNITTFYFDPVTGHISYEGGSFIWELADGSGDAKDGHLLWGVNT